MKKILITIGIVGLIAIIGVFIFTTMHSQQPAQQPIGTATFPASSGTSSNGKTITITTADNSSISTRDFLKDSSTWSDPVNSGYYLLGDKPSADGGTQNLPYLIQYIAQTNYFNISIQQEPLGTTRKLAEQFLMQNLGITQAQMCALKYDVTVPDSVNTLYAAQNLGFSFCPGAVQLP